VGSPRRKSTRRQTALNPAHARRARCPPASEPGSKFSNCPVVSPSLCANRPLLLYPKSCVESSGCKPPEFDTVSVSLRQGRWKIPTLPSTHLCLHYHLVFGTKDHAPVIASAWHGDLHAFMCGIVRTLGGVPESVDGVSDHVHLMVGLRATHCLSDVMCELKSVSSRWLHETPGYTRQWLCRNALTQ
jgi:REP element-mobilizing transposase RayT